ncbi:phage tail protein [Escherichia coli]
MATKYYAVLTNVGAAKLANATALGAQVEITQMAVGDGNGVLPTPNPAQTALVHELRRKPLNSLSIDPNNANQIIAEQVIPEDEGGWWIREIGLFDKDGDMIAVANCAETYKPQLQEGSGRVQVVRMILIVSSTAAVTLKIDPSVVLATRQYVDDQIIQVKSYVDQKMAAHVAAADPHKQYAPKESPALTGRPTAPTAEGKDSSTQIANTAFVQAAIAALVGSSPEALDTLNELAAALGNDPNFATTVTNSLAGKMDKSANGSDIENVSVFLQNLGIKDASTTQVGLVRLTSSRVSESETLAATAKAAAMNYADIVALQGKTNDATTTNKGIIRVSDSRTSTESGVAASSLAASQNYSDMKGLFGQCGMKSRNLGVVYTNSQSFAIFVSVNAVLSDGSSFLSSNVNVDGNSANFRGSQTTNLAGQRATIAFMVPAGATYIVQQFSGTVSDVTWVEVDKK